VFVDGDLRVFLCIGRVDAGTDLVVLNGHSEAVEDRVFKKLSAASRLITSWVPINERGTEQFDSGRPSSKIIQIGTVFVYLNTSTCCGEASRIFDALPALLVEGRPGVSKSRAVTDAITIFQQLGIHVACCDVEIILDEAAVSRETHLIEAETSSIESGVTSPSLRSFMRAAAATNGLMILNNFGAVVRATRLLAINKSDKLENHDVVRRGGAALWFSAEIERWSKMCDVPKASGIVMTCDEPINLDKENFKSKYPCKSDQGGIIHDSILSIYRFEDVVTITANDLPGLAAFQMPHREPIKNYFKSHTTLDQGEINILGLNPARGVQTLVCADISQPSGENLMPPRWQDIGGCWAAKDELEKAIFWPKTCTVEFCHFTLRTSRGIILHGPPGNGKTLLARAVANHMKARFIDVRSAELVLPYLGESESAIRRFFAVARENTPCVLFFDELDAIGMARGDAEHANGSNLRTRLVATLLNELDGVLDENDGVLVLAATNRLNTLDAALIRPGRLEVSIYVPMPSFRDRWDILALASNHLTLGEDIQIAELAAETFGASAAQLTSLCREAVFAALDDSPDARYVNKANFSIALGQ
jgi:MoxR-like ATPase